MQPGDNVEFRNGAGFAAKAGRIWEKGAIVATERNVVTAEHLGQHYNVNAIYVRNALGSS